MGRGPPRALRLLRARARPAAGDHRRLRRRRPAARAGRAVLARQRRLHAVRRDRARSSPPPSCSVPTSRAPTGGVVVALHEHRHRHALPRSRSAAGRVRDGAHHGRDRRRARPRPRRGAAAQLHHPRRDALRPPPDLPGRPAADLRLRRLPRLAREAEGAGRLGRRAGGGGRGPGRRAQGRRRARLLRRGHRGRPVRGRARRGRDVRQGQGRDRADDPGPGPLHLVRPDRRRRAGRAVRGRRGGHR